MVYSSPKTGNGQNPGNKAIKSKKSDKGQAGKSKVQESGKKVKTGTTRLIQKKKNL